MANESPTQIAREAKEAIGLLTRDVELFQRQMQELDLIQLRERVKVLEEQLAQVSKKAEENDKLRQLIAVLEDRVSELKKAKEEADRRQWQFVYIFAGAMASLLVTVVVQLVISLVKKS